MLVARPLLLTTPVSSDGFLNNSPTTGTLSQLANHSTWTLRAFGGIWDDTDEQTAKTWCDKCLTMIKSSGDVVEQQAGATMLASVIAQLTASPHGYMETVYPRCADGVVWLLKHCRATSLKGSVGLESLETATFDCCIAMLNALNAHSASHELRKRVAQLLSDLMPHFTSMLSLGTMGVTGVVSLERLLRTTTLALVLYEHKMRPYLGPLRGAFLRARLFVGTPTHIVRLTARCWSLVIAERCRTQKPKDGNEGNSERNAVGTDATLEVPARYWEEECMRVINSMHDVLRNVCPAAAKAVDAQEERLEEISAADDGDNEQAAQQQQHRGGIGEKTETSLSNRMEMLSYLLSSMLSSGPTGPPGRAMLAIVPVVALVDLLERMILCALNCQVVDDVDSSSNGDGLHSDALRSFVPRLYAAFGRIFPALVDSVSLLRYTSRISTTLVRGLRFVSHGRNNVSCPAALVDLLSCCHRYSIRHGGALRQSFVEPVILLCVREVHIRMMSQPTNNALIGAIVDMGASGSGRKGGKCGKRGKKRGRGGIAVLSSSSSSSTTPAGGAAAPRGTSLSTDTTLPTAPESNASHRRCCLALIRTIDSLLQSSSHHIGTVVYRDVRTMLYGLTNHIDVRPTSLMECSTTMMGSSVHDGVRLRIAVYELLTSCVLLPSASGSVSGGSLLGHAMQVYHDGLNDGDFRIVQTCRRSILMLRPILHPQVAPLRTFEPKIAPMAKRYKTAWPTTTAEVNASTASLVMSGTHVGLGAVSMVTKEVIQSKAQEKQVQEDNTPIQVNKIVLEVVSGASNNGQEGAPSAASTSGATAPEDEDDEDFPDIVT
jgi:hypothetical protein